MHAFVNVMEEDQLPEGQIRKVTVQGREILLARAGGMVFAGENRCPHFSGDLSKGTLNGTVITCPSHHSEFDLRDGSVLRWTSLTGIALKAASLLKPPRPLTVYPAKIENGAILVSIGTA